MADADPSGPPAFPMRRSCPFLPPEQYAGLRKQGPAVRAVLPSGQLAWLVTRHGYARQVLADPRVSVDRSRPGYPAVAPIQTRVSQRPAGFLTWMDPPEHTTYRKMLIGEFTAKRLQGMRPHIQQIVDNYVTEMLAGPKPADLVQALSLPISIRVICDLLGVPYDDRELFQHRASTLGNPGNTAQQKAVALRELRAYFADLVASKEKNRGEDLLSRLIKNYQLTGELDTEHLSGLATLLLTSGFETTANMISLGVLALLDRPDQLSILRAEPERAPGAVEELLRFFSIAEISTSRVAAEDINLDGVLIREGEGIIALNSAANHDERQFIDPQQLDLRRDAHRHLAFGYGIHQCLGQNLARLELEITYTTLFEWVPTLMLTMPAERLPFKHGMNFYGLHEMPVTW